MKIQKTVAYEIINNVIYNNGIYSLLDKNIEIDLPILNKGTWKKADEEKEKILKYYMFWNEHDMEKCYDIFNMEKREIYLKMNEKYQGIPLLLRKVEYRADLIDKKHLKDKLGFKFEPKLHLCYQNKEIISLLERV